MLKQINTEDLKVGQECYIKVVTRKNSDGSITMIDEAGYAYFPSRGEPIYTLDDQPNQPDPELEMLVNVASELYATTNFGNYDTCAREAADLIAACKQIKEGER